jgi:DNA-directed RNA polymerase specialized sigma24 family protein
VPLSNRSDSVGLERRKVFEFAYFRGYHPSDIGHVLSMPIETVKAVCAA